MATEASAGAECTLLTSPPVEAKGSSPIIADGSNDPQSAARACLMRLMQDAEMEDDANMWNEEWLVVKRGFVHIQDNVFFCSSRMIELRVDGQNAEIRCDQAPSLKSWRRVLSVTVYSWKKYELEVRLERPSRSLLVSSGRGSRFLAAPFRSPSPVSGRASSRPSIHAHAEDMGRLSIQSRGSLAGNIVQQIVMRISSCSELWDWLNCFPQEIVDVDSQNALAAGMGFYWTIGDFHRLVEREGHKTQRSPTFQIGDCEWRLRLHPTGSTSSFARSANHSTPLHISIFLEIVGVKYPSNSWSCGVGVTVTIENADHRRAIVRQAPLIFSETMVANGWQNFAPLDEILNHNSGFTDRGSLVVSVNLSCVSIGEATHAS